jgi:ABC-2 type transport system ATP-binding protein
MKQKLAIARALLHRPELIFLDEPTAGLDPLAAAALRDQLSRLVENEGVTVFLTTHNLAEAERLCALVGVVRNGQLLASAPPKQLGVTDGTTRVEITGSGFVEAMLHSLLKRPSVLSARSVGRSVVVDLQSEVAIPEVVSALVSLGFQVEGVRGGAGSLEDAFQHLVEEQT